MNDYCEHQWQDEQKIEQLEAEIERLTEALKAARDLAGYWIMQGDRRSYSEQEYKTWLALGYHSKAMKQIEAALAGKEPRD